MINGKTNASRIQALELQLEEALQMLRLVSKNLRTCLEVEEWLKQNYPDNDESQEIVSALLNITRKRKPDGSK
jgi:hypothetical protein